MLDCEVCFILSNTVTVIIKINVGIKIMNLFPSRFTKQCGEILPRGKNALYTCALFVLGSLCMANNALALSCSTSADTWGSGYVLNVTVTNDGSSAISAWQVALDFSQSPGVSGSWNANCLLLFFRVKVCC